MTNMTKKSKKSRSETPEKFGKKTLGAVLREVRNDAKLDTDFASHIEMSSSFIRMIESGNASVPLSKIGAYSAALSFKAARGGPAIDPDSLLLAYSSLRSLKANFTDRRFDWKELQKKNDVEAQKYVREQLISARDLSAIDSNTNLVPEARELNPIQLQLIRDVATRVKAFGSAIVSEEALAVWETENATDIRVVRAAVTSLASELSASFLDSISTLAAEPNFEGFEYLVFNSNANAISNATSRIRAELAKRKVNPSVFKYKKINSLQFEQISESIGATDSLGWDSYYLYECIHGPSLMVGVFRRFARDTSKVPTLTIPDYGGTPINEVLPHSAFARFAKVHQRIFEQNNA